MLPPVGPLLIAAAGMIVLRRWPRLGRGLVWTGLAVLAVLSTGAVASVLLRLVDVSPPLRLDDARSAQAIVILGGGVRRSAPEYGGDTVARLSLERVRYGARVAKATGVPVLVTGGAPRGGMAEAVVMREALEQEFGVAVRWVEDRARNTHENAQRSAALLKRDGVERVVLVAHGFDIRRAKAEFEAAGLAVVPAPTFLPGDTPFAPGDFVPSVAALQSSYYALYELAAYPFRGW